MGQTDSSRGLLTAKVEGIPRTASAISGLLDHI